jgi:hypothetical protein
MKRLVDSVEDRCFDDYDKDCHTPLWKVKINGRSFRTLKSTHSREKESTQLSKTSFADSPLETLH